MFVFQQSASKVAQNAFDVPVFELSQILQNFEKNPQDLNVAIIQVNSILRGNENNFDVVLSVCSTLLELASIAHTKNLTENKNFNVSTALSELERISPYLLSATNSLGDASTTFMRLEVMCREFWMGVTDKGGKDMEETFILQNYKMPISNMSLEKFFTERILLPAARRQIYSTTQGMKTGINPNLVLISQLFDVLQNYEWFQTPERMDYKKEDSFLDLIIESIKDCTNNLSSASMDAYEISRLDYSLPRLRKSISDFIGHELFSGPTPGRRRLDEDGGELQTIVFSSLGETFGSLGPSDFYTFFIAQRVRDAIEKANSK